MSILDEIKKVEGSIKSIVDSRLKEFSSFKDKSEEEWFSELCFCILTANSKQKTGAAIQLELGPRGFLDKSRDEIRSCIIKNKHRFHNNKSNYIVEARKYSDIKSIVSKMPSIEARNWIVKNIKGLGMKEASHFLRNTGTTNLAILDRHILNLMSEHKLIERPKNLTPKNYILLEQKFNSIAKKLNMSPAKLDLIMWYMKTGEVLK